MYGVLLIVVLIITGGAIAFIGDRLGTKIGKKRLSIFGLRPKHTSIIITIFTGICITTLTFGVLAATSKNVRTALFGMEKLNRTMAETKANLQQAQSDLAAAQKEQDDTNAALEQSKDQVSKLQDQQKNLEEESAKLQEGNRQLELAKADLTQRNNDLAVQNGDLADKNSALSSQNESLASSNQELTSKNDSLTENNAQLEKRAQELGQGLITVREGDIVFRAGEVIASGVIRGNRPEADVASDLQSLAQLANRNVAAASGQDGSGTNIWVYQPEYDAAVKTIAESPTDMVVRIVATSNIVRGEAVRTTLELYQNSVVYKNNEFIIAKPYTLQSGSETEAEQTIMNFLKEVNVAATSRGILQDPIRGSVGVMDGSEFYDVVGALKGIRGPVVLSAYAKGDTDALGPLRLNIKVEQRSSDSENAVH